MFCHRNFCDQYVINGLKPLKMGPNCTERKWIIIQPSMWRVSIYNTFQREELVRRSIFTEGKFLVYKSQDALRRQLKHCDKKHQWVNFTKTQGEVCGGSTDDDGGGAAARIRLGVLVEGYLIAGASDPDFLSLRLGSGKWGWCICKDQVAQRQGHVTQQFWSTLNFVMPDRKASWRSEFGWFLNSWRENVPLSRTRNVPLQRKLGGMPRVSSSTNTYTKTKVISNGTAAVLRNTVTGQPWNLLYILPQQKNFSMFAQKQPSYIVLRLPQLLTIMGATC